MPFTSVEGLQAVREVPPFCLMLVKDKSHLYEHLSPLNIYLDIGTAIAYMAHCPAESIFTFMVTSWYPAVTFTRFESGQGLNE
mmetsp:Transcript_74841/g.219275  ORF Transcript_74841/g.219275 Transcript_74841/m.219275 type:complete len:83 (+) Transcript_74841:324-572(+)